jgi:crossover junction endonuclease EME1
MNVLHHNVEVSIEKCSPSKMPVEIIDLVSSPETSSSRFSGKNRLPALTEQPLPKKTLTYESLNRGNDSWLSLSSDSEMEVAQKSSLNPANKPPQYPKPTNQGNGGYFNSDDFDSTINLDDSYAIDLPPAKKRCLSSSPEILLPKSTAPRTSGQQRWASNVERFSYKTQRQKSSAPSMQKSKSIGVVLESDPIVFTSSPDPFVDIARRREERRRDQIGESDEDDIFGLNPPAKTKSGRNSGGDDISDVSSDIDLPDLDKIVENGALEGGPEKSSLSVVDSYYAERAKEKKAKEAALKAGERQAKKESREAEKEQRRLAREEKANEKERLAEIARVNIVRTNKQKSSHEMMVDFPSTMTDSELGAQVVKLLDKAEIRHSSWESSLPIVKWRREVSSEYKEETGQWEPVPTRVEKEDHILFVMSAKEFVELAISGEGDDVDTHILRLRAKFPSRKIIYLIEGLMAWMRKNKTIQNRKYTEIVRNQGQDEPTSSQRAKKKNQEEYIDEDLVEDALLRLQVMHGALIHHTAVMVETAEWILVFTQHISTVPYR